MIHSVQLSEIFLHWFLPCWQLPAWGIDMPHPLIGLPCGVPLAMATIPSWSTMWNPLYLQASQAANTITNRIQTWWYRHLLSQAVFSIPSKIPSIMKTTWPDCPKSSILLMRQLVDYAAHIINGEYFIYFKTISYIQSLLPLNCFLHLVTRMDTGFGSFIFR